MPPGPVIVFARTSHSANHPLHSIYILWVCESLICCCRRKRLIWWDTVSLPIYAHVCMTAFCWTHASQHLQHVTHSKHDYRDCILKPGPTWRWATGRPLEDLSLWTLGWQWSIFKTLNQGITWVSTLRNWLVLRKGVLIYLILTYLNIEMRGRERCVYVLSFFWLSVIFSLHVAKTQKHVLNVPKTQSRGTCKCIMLLDLNMSQFIGFVDLGALILAHERKPLCHCMYLVSLICVRSTV